MCLKRLGRFSQQFFQPLLKQLPTPMYFNTLGFCLSGGKIMPVEVRCPKCGSKEIEKKNNQERRCSKCGEIFYFVTPQCGSQTDLERYNL
jgi:NADH pyrophosphatase NudC (nudix superfamily)